MMNVSTILDHIDSGHMALPEFQRGYVWNRDQVRALMMSLYNRYPVGSLLVWATKSETARYRGDGTIQPGVVKLLLDGQQRMTSLYGIIRGKPPKFFDGKIETFTGLYFHLEAEEFSFYMPIKMRDDPLWIDVTRLMREGLDPFIDSLGTNPQFQSKFSKYISRLNRIQGIRDIAIHAEEVTGEDKSIDVVVDIFNRVNSGGTKLSKGDLALAKVCAEAPDARGRMKSALKSWWDAGYHFDLDWFLRNINTVATGEAKFNALHDIDAANFEDGLKRAEKVINYLLNIIAGRLGLDHERVFFGRYAMPVMARYVDQRGGRVENAEERDKLLYWYLQSALWGRFSSSTESTINKDLETIEDLDGALDGLIKELRLWRGNLTVEPGNFDGWSLGARFYPLLYLLTRMGEARDWGTGLPLRGNLLGKMNRLEVHHIFPRKLLYKQGHGKAQVNAVANYCFLTKDTNLKISATAPEVYFKEIEKNHPGALASQWIPMDPSLWAVDRYLDFLAERRKLLAEAANTFFEELLSGQGATLETPGLVVPDSHVPAPPIDEDEEQELLIEANLWTIDHGLAEGEMLYELQDPTTGEPTAILDLAWPEGVQRGLSQPVALLLNESPETLAAASAAGLRYFVSVEAFKRYVEKEVLGIVLESSEEAA
jgi:hypothetical protein